MGISPSVYTNEIGGDKVANIIDKILAIRQAIYGKEIRKTIADGIEAINTEVESTTGKQNLLEAEFNQLIINAGAENAEIVQAHVNAGGFAYTSLQERLNNSDTQLASIPNQTYITEKAKQTDLNATNAIVAQKANEFDVRLKSVKLSATYDFDDETKAQMTGVTPITYSPIPPTSSINERMIAPKTISAARTAFIEIGKNLLDMATKSPLGNWVNYSSGAFESYPTNEWISFYYHSAPILVTPGQSIARLYGQDGYAFFDANMTFISGGTVSNFTVPASAVFLIVNFTNAHMDEQVENGSIVTEREPYGYKLKSYLPKSIPTSALMDGDLVVESDIRKLRYHLNLPSKIYGVVGKEVNVYLDNLMIDDASKYNFNVECAVGIQQSERWTAVPTEVIETNLSIDVYKDCGDITEKLTDIVSTLRVVGASAGSGLNKKYLQIGDSTTWNMMNYGYLLANFTDDVMTLTQIGTQGTAPNLHEGYLGMDTEFVFSNPACPLVYNGAFDFAHYMATQGYAGVDIVTFAMGINDMYGMQSDAQANAQIATSMAQYEYMINNIHSYNPAIKVGILLTIPPTKSQDAFGADGPQAQTRFRHKRNIMLWVKRCIEVFGAREASNIFVVPYATNLDTEHNFSYQSAQVNARNPLVVDRQANALHPDYSGCWQMADSVYFWIKNIV
jgi:hypothetical protein